MISQETFSSQETYSNEEVLVPTIHDKPLRMRQLDDSEDDPFLYYCLSKSRIGGLRYAQENASKEGKYTTGTKRLEERRTRYSTETHPMNDLIMLYKMSDVDLEVNNEDLSNACL